MGNNFVSNPNKMTPEQLEIAAHCEQSLPDSVMDQAARSLLDTVVDDQRRIDSGRKMEYEDIFSHGKSIGGVNYIRSTKSGETISRYDAYLLCKQMMTVLIRGRLCKITAEDSDFALMVAEFRLGSGHILLTPDEYEDASKKVYEDMGMEPPIEPYRN